MKEITAYKTFDGMVFESKIRRLNTKKQMLLDELRTLVSDFSNQDPFLVGKT